MNDFMHLFDLMSHGVSLQEATEQLQIKVYRHILIDAFDIYVANLAKNIVDTNDNRYVAIPDTDDRSYRDNTPIVIWNICYVGNGGARQLYMASNPVSFDNEQDALAFCEAMNLGSIEVAKRHVASNLAAIAQQL